MSRVAEKVIRIGPRASIIFEMAVGPYWWIFWPSVIYFPANSPLGLSPSRGCRDFALVWLKFGITLRIE